MSRTNKRTLDEIADLKREIKERDATIKALQREVKALNAELTPKTKKKGKAPVQVIAEEIDSAHKCPKCPKKLAVTHLGPKVLFTCDCGFRLLKKPSEN